MTRAGPMGLGMTLGVPLFLDHLPSPLQLLALGLLATALALLWRSSPVPALLMGFTLGGLAVATLPDGPRLRGPVALQGVVVSAAIGTTADVSVSRARELGGGWHDTSGRVRVRFPDARLAVPGTEVVVMGDASEPDQHGPPGAPDQLRTLRMARVHTALDGWDARRVGGDPARPRRVVSGMLRAIALGDRSDVDEEMIQIMRATGTAHLLAVSGSNVGLAAVAAVYGVRLLLGLYALRRPAGLGGPWVPLAAMLGAVAFTVLVGLPTSAQRAMVGAVVVALGAAGGRQLEPAAVIGLAAMGLILADPSTVASASFHLSFGAVIGLATWGKRLDAALPESWPAWVLAPLRLLAASSAATIGTLPASAWWFQSLAPLGVLANLFAVPWSTFVLTPCAFAALLGPEALAGPAMWVGDWATEVQRAVLRPMAIAPWTPAVGPVGALLLCGVFVLATRAKAAVALVAAVLLWPRTPPADLRLTMIDIGQGMSVLVERADGSTWLVDGGPPRSDVLAGLRRMGVRHLDHVVVTHGDLDHRGGLAGVIEQLEVGELNIASTDGVEALIAAAEARGIPVVDDPAQRLYPQGDVAPNRNDGAIVLQIGEPCRVLLMADVSVNAEAVMLDRLPACAVLQVGHHGSATSTSDALLDRVRPSLALVPVGRGNTYGHPTADALDRLSGHRVPSLRTDLLGTIELEWRGEEVLLRTHRYGAGWSAPRPVPSPP